MNSLNPSNLTDQYINLWRASPDQTINYEPSHQNHSIYHSVLDLIEPYFFTVMGLSNFSNGSVHCRNTGKKELSMISCNCCCAVVLRPSQQIMVILSQSDNLHCSWAGLDLLWGYPILVSHTFARTWQLPFLDQRKGENDSRKYLTIHLHESYVDRLGFNLETLDPQSDTLLIIWLRLAKQVLPPEIGSVVIICTVSPFNDALVSRTGVDTPDVWGSAT